MRWPPRTRSPGGGAGAGALARIRATLSTALSDAVTDRVLERHPCPRVRLPHTGEAPHRPAVWSPQQAASFLRAAAAHPLARAFGLLRTTGLRRGELVGLRWADVDLGAGELHICHTITQRSALLREGRPKTRSGERSVALDAATGALLVRQRARVAALRLAAGPAWADQV